jgi:hypothetical protein
LSAQVAEQSSTWPWSLFEASPGLVRPGSLTVDRSLPEERARQLVHLTQQLYTFWHTGEQSYLDAAVGPEFTDDTLPPDGRRASQALLSRPSTSARPCPI